MLIYQLPSGKVIMLTLEQYLDLTDEDIAFLENSNLGDTVNSPWFGSSIGTVNYNKTSQEIDFEEDIEEIYKDDEIKLDYTDDIPDIPDDISEID